MGEVVVKIPEKLKERMSKLSWIDWASVAKKSHLRKTGRHRRARNKEEGCRNIRNSRR